MSWYQEAMLKRAETPASPRDHWDAVEEAVAWLFLAGWAMAIIAEVAKWA